MKGGQPRAAIPHETFAEVSSCDQSNIFLPTYLGGTGVSPVRRRLTYHDPFGVTTKDENLEQPAWVFLKEMMVGGAHPTFGLSAPIHGLC